MTIILHAGTNDVFDNNTYTMRQMVHSVLHGIRQILPSTRILWSDVLPRLFFYGERKAGRGRRITHFINAQAHKFIGEMDNAGFIIHAAVFPVRNFGLFHYDCIHLSTEGYIVFRMHLAEALLFFNSHCQAKVFPPLLEGI